MPKVRFEPDGIEIEVPVGTSILEASNKAHAQVGSACGGVCACSTCHVYVKQGLGDLEGASDREEDIMDKAFDVRSNSRLGCQSKIEGEDATIVVAAIAAQAIPLVAQMKVQDSQDAVDAGNGNAALSAAKTAVSVEPWAASTHLQLALVDEQLGDLRTALREARAAVAHDDADWSLWVVRARLETKLGQIPAARQSLKRAAALNPHSPLFASNSSG